MFYAVQRIVRKSTGARRQNRPTSEPLGADKLRHRDQPLIGEHPGWVPADRTRPGRLVRGFGRQLFIQMDSLAAAGLSGETKSVCGATILGNQRGPPWPSLYLTTPHKCLWTQSCRSSTTEDTEKGPRIEAVRPSRRPLRGLLRVRTFLNAIKVLPHAEERSQSASRSTHRQRCRLSRSLFCVEPNSAARHDCPMQTYGKRSGLVWGAGFTAPADTRCPGFAVSTTTQLP